MRGIQKKSMRFWVSLTRKKVVATIAAALVACSTSIVFLYPTHAADQSDTSARAWGAADEFSGGSVQPRSIQTRSTTNSASKKSVSVSKVPVASSRLPRTDERNAPEEKTLKSEQAPNLAAVQSINGPVPQGWIPQTISYWAQGSDGRAVLFSFAPTYVFTYAIGPPVPLVQVAAPLSAGVVNRKPPPGVAPSNVRWQYATSGAAAIPVGIAIARGDQPQQYQAQFSPPTTSPQVSAQTLAPQAQSPPLVAPAVVLAPSGLPSPIKSEPQQIPATSLPQVSASASKTQAIPTSSTPHNELWRVVGVHDGDTVTCIDESNVQHKIRLAEMDAPELGQDFGSRSREALAGMVFGKTIHVVSSGTDRYGRVIGHIDVDGVDVNRQMIATGNAWHYAAYSKDKSLVDVQAQAQAKKLGLWAQQSPVPPWDYRKNGKKKST